MTGAFAVPGFRWGLLFPGSISRGRHYHLLLMPNFTLSEILTIALVILIVFGPQRLPEMAQKAGQLVRRARTVITDLRREFEGEWQEVAQPLKDVRREVVGMKDEVAASMTDISDDVARVKEEMEAELADTRKGIEGEVAATDGEIPDTPSDPEDEAGAGP